MAVSPKPLRSDDSSKLIPQYGCGPVKFTGTDEALYERHLFFDNVVAVTQVSLRERFEAVARSVRDVLSQRWIRTEQTYERENPKRVYYLSLRIAKAEVRLRASGGYRPHGQHSATPPYPAVDAPALQRIHYVPVHIRTT